MLANKNTSVRISDIPRHLFSAWRIVYGAICLAVSLLSVFPAPTTVLWMLAIGATEWGHILALSSLLPLLLPGWRRSRKGRIGVGLGLIAACLAISPAIRGALLSRELRAKLDEAFGDVPPRSTQNAPSRPGPFVWRDLFRRINQHHVRPDQLEYIVRDETSLSLDFYPSVGQTAGSPTPCVIVIHGGSWQNGDSAQMSSLNEYLAVRGYAVASINYRLGPQHPFPDALNDLLAALSYLKAHAEQLHIDPQRFVLLGRSAGAQLALLAAYTSHDRAIKGAISFYGPADLRYSYEHPGNPLVIDTHGILEAYLKGNPAQSPDKYDAASPFNFVGPSSLPTLLIHGGRDELVSPVQSKRLSAKLMEAGAPHFLLILPWATHGCDFNLSGPCGQISTYAVERFLSSVTR